MPHAFTKRTAPVLGAVAAVVALVGAQLFLTAGVSGADTFDDSIEDYAYSPAELTVKVGDTVRWTNKDKAPHTVTSSDAHGPLDSPNMQTGDTWSYTFADDGEYAYYCAIHPDMTGKVTVVPAAGPDTPPPPSTTTTTTTSPDHMEHGEPPATTTTTTTVPPSEPGKEPEACDSTLFAAMLTPFVAHFDAAHLESSPGQQASDASDVDQYAKTHTVMVEAMWMPLVHLLLVAPEGIAPFVEHFDSAHLETSPGQQVAEATDVDQYAKTHTVLFEHMLAPTAGSIGGSC